MDPQQTAAQLMPLIPKLSNSELDKSITIFETMIANPGPEATPEGVAGAKKLVSAMKAEKAKRGGAKKFLIGGALLVGAIWLVSKK